MPFQLPFLPKPKAAAPSAAPTPAPGPTPGNPGTGRSRMPRFLAGGTDELQANRAEALAAEPAGAEQVLHDLAVDPEKVQIYDDARAHQAAQGQQAQAFTHGDQIYFNRGQYNPSSTAGRALLAHELTHVAQQRAGTTAGIHPKSLSAAPAAARKRLELPSAPTSIPEETLTEYFEAMEGGRWGSSRAAPVGVAVELSGIDARFQMPMTSLAMYLNAQVSYPSTVTDAVKPMFGPGVMLTLQLALAQFGLADGTYRFAWTGDDQSGVIYIEALAATPKAQNMAEVKESTVTVGGLTFATEGKWTNARMAYLKQALALIPIDALKRVDKLKFKIESGSGDGEDGHYEEDQHTIVLLTSLFDISDSRFGVSPKPVQEIAHEIGHAVDLAPLRAAWQKYSGTGKSRDLTGAASPSGSKWAKGADDQWEMAERITKTDGAFRTAARKDGAGVTKTKITDDAGAEVTLTHLKGGVSDYSNTNWTELFAESFALYTTDPDTLKLIRPAIFAYMAKEYPRKK